MWISEKVQQAESKCLVKLYEQNLNNVLLY